MPYRGFLDYVRQSHLTGWAADSEKPVPVSIVINGREIAVVHPNVTRLDLAPLGLPALSGFIYNFPEPLALDDEVSVLFPDKTHLISSPSLEHRIRLSEILDGIDPSGMGLELGPLDKPLISKTRSNILYVDHASKADLVLKYAGTSETIVAVDQIPEIDIVWAGGPLSAVCPPGTKFDYCVSSHAIEHVPDMIGWIRGITEVLKVGGLINLAIPNRDQTFDRRRRLTSTSEFVADYLEKRTRPSARQIFDAIAYFEPVSETVPVNFAHGLAVSQQTELSQAYLDIHCQVFTLKSFLEVFSDLAEMSLVNVALRKAYPCRPGNNEFVVSLQKTVAGATEIASSFRMALLEISDQD